MKKTLIAAAALAVAGAASAQVTLSGKLRFGYNWAESAAGAKTSGIGVTDGDFVFTAVEDLGGGMKATLSNAVRARGRDAATDTLSGSAADGPNGVRPRDAYLMLSGGFGSVMVGAIEFGNGLLGLVNSGGPTLIGLDNGTQLAAASNGDTITYTSPATGGLSFKVGILDAVGTAGSQNGGQSSVIGLNYSAGPLSVAADYSNYGSASAASADKRTRISASYSLGSIRLGYGYQDAGNGTAADKSENAIGVNTTMGAWTLGLVYASSSTDGTAGNNTGVDLGAQYALSKTSYVGLQYQRTTSAGASTSASNMRLQLSKAF